MEPQKPNGTDRFIHTVVLNDLEFGKYKYYIDVENQEKTVYSFEVNNWQEENSNLMMVFADLGVDNDQERANLLL